LSLNEIYIYLALAIGIFLEGEIVLISAAFAASQGILDIYKVGFVSFIATQFSDWLYFYLGRVGGKKVVRKKAKWRLRAKRMNKWIRKYPKSILLTYRFLYGFRIIIPLMLGASHIKAITFMIYSMLSTILWLILLGGVGYFFGAVVSDKIVLLQQYFKTVIAIVVAIIVLYFLYKRYIKNKKQ
jgi:membrane protein DedA with SNARE-associated domain